MALHSGLPLKSRAGTCIIDLLLLQVLMASMDEETRRYEEKKERIESALSRVGLGCEALAPRHGAMLSWRGP